MFTCKGFAVHSAADKFKPFSFERRDPLPFDVDIEILYCGICHSDIHTARDEWRSELGETFYPCVPGHEIVGRVLRTGDKVTKFRKGDTVGVGCLVDSCRKCENCKQGLENYCLSSATFTYNSPDKEMGKDRITFGGYSNRIVVNQDFVLRVPENLNLAAAAPLLCAGITTYSPLRHWGAGKGKKVGVVGLGGLGHMAVKNAHAMGADVTMITTSPSKKPDAQKLGAHHVIISKDAEEMKAAAGTLDLIIDTVAAKHDLDMYLQLLRLNGTLVQVGIPEKPLEFHVGGLVGLRRSISGSLIGGIEETQEMLDFCGRHNVTAEIEMIAPDKIDEAYERMLKSDVKYRFVMDMSKI